MSEFCLDKPRQEGGLAKAGLFLTLMEDAPAISMLVDNNGLIAYANTAAKRFFHLPDVYQIILFHRILPIQIRSTHTAHSQRPDTEKRRNGTGWRTEKGYPFEGEPVIVEISLSQVFDKETPYTLVILKPAKASVKENFLQKEKYHRLQTYVSFSPMGILYLDSKLNCEYVNDTWCRLTGLTVEESLNQGWLSPFEYSRIRTLVNKISYQSSEQQIREELQITTPLGHKKWVIFHAQPIQNASGSRMGITASIQDIDDLVQARQSLQMLANHDVLTALPNRQMFMVMLNQSIRKVHRKSSFALFFIDLNEFKGVNDQHGHDAGDEYLKICSMRIKESVREGDVVARLGGDEFTALIEGQVQVEVLSAIAEKIIAHLAKPMVVAGETFYPTAAIGISVCKDAKMDANALIQQADKAMYAAKKEHGSAFSFYSSQSNQKAELRQYMSHALPSALAHDEMKIWYQTQQHVSTNVTSGWEALLRWNSRAIGLISPQQFVPVMEASQVIHAITHWLIEQVVIKAKELIKDVHLGVETRISFNLSARSIRDKQFIPRFKEILSEHQVPGKWFTCEITESVMLNDFDRAQDFVKNLRELGVKIALDDFGTGYCSLLYLRKFPIDYIKIDTRFVQGMVMQKEDQTIVKTIINLAHNLNMKVIAEGVETDLQLQQLKQLGCDFYQGFLTCKPKGYPIGQFK